MKRLVFIGTTSFVVGVAVGAFMAAVVSDPNWLRSTLQAAISWSVLGSVISIASAVVGSLAAAIGLPMIYFQLKHTESQTRAALGDEDPFVDAVERLSRPGEFVVKVVNLNRRAMRVIDVAIEEGAGSCRIDVVDINGEKRPSPESSGYRLPAMIPGWGNRSDEPPWMMVDVSRIVESSEGKPVVLRAYPSVIHCSVIAKPVGKEGLHSFRCRVVSELEIRAASPKR